MFICGFVPFRADPCVLYKVISPYLVLMFVLYVDDLFLSSSELSAIEQTKAQLAQQFNDLGPARHFLGLRIHYSLVNCFSTNKHPHVAESDVQVPMISTQRFDDISKYSSTTAPFPKLIGALLFIALDQTYAVHYLAQLILKSEHRTAAKRILQYFKKYPPASLLYDQSKISKSICGAIGRSMSGYVALYAGAPVTWKSKKQPTVALPTTEAEFVSARHLLHISRNVFHLPVCG